MRRLVQTLSLIVVLLASAAAAYSQVPEIVSTI
jgi:hypothetical protein